MTQNSIASNDFDTNIGFLPVLTIYPGERVGGNIPRNMSVDTLLYDHSRWTGLRLRVHSILIGQENLRKKISSNSLHLTIALSAILVSGSFLYSRQPDLPDRQNTQVAATKNVTVANTDSTVKTIAPVQQNVPAMVVPAVAALPLNDEPPGAQGIVTSNVEATAAEQVVSETTPGRSISQQAQKMPSPSQVQPPLPSALRLPIMADAKASGGYSKTPQLPPIPTTLNLPQSAPANVAKVATQDESPLLAVDITKPEEKQTKQVAIVKEDVALPEDVQIKTKVVGPSKEVIARSPIPMNPQIPSLPNYTVLTITKKSVVITDPKTKMPAQFNVGSALPSGEVVKSVNEDEGIVVTDARSIKMK